MPIWLPMKVWVPAQTAVSLPRRWELRPTGSSSSGGRPTTSTAPGSRASRVRGTIDRRLEYAVGDLRGDRRQRVDGTSGIQQDLNVFTSFSCNEATLIPGLRVNYIPTSCGSPTPTPNGDPTATATTTATATATRNSNCRRQLLRPRQLPQRRLLPPLRLRRAEGYSNTKASSDTAAPAVRLADR